MRTVIIFLISITIGIALIYSLKTGVRQTTYVRSPYPIPISFSLDKAPSESIKGTIASLSGNVGWQSRTATETAQITKPQEIQQGEAIETKDNGKMTLQFENVFTSYLSQNTFLNIVQTLPTQFVIDQSKGKTDFEKLGQIPLTIRSYSLLIAINDSDGDVEIETNEKRGIITTSVKKGSITVAYNDSKQETTRVLTIDEGNQYIFNNDTKKGNVKPI